MWFLLFDRQTQDKKTAQRGFTLIELMLVIALMGVVAFLAVSSFDGDQRESRINVTRLEMVELRKALLQFRRDTREFPCRVFRTGDYNPDTANDASPTMELPDGRLDFRSGSPLNNPTSPPKPSTQEHYSDWCQDSLRNASDEDVIQADNALSMLVQFPYSTATRADLLWNRDTEIGWNGPYIDKNGLKDAWGKPYKLIDAELDYDQRYLCQSSESGSDWYRIGSEDNQSYECLATSDPGFGASYYLPADIIRLVSTGPNGRLDTEFDETTLTDSDSDNWDDPCSPDPDTDDLVLCLLR